MMEKVASPCLSRSCCIVIDLAPSVKIRGRRHFWVFAVDYAHTFSPALIDLYHRPFDSWGKVAQKNVGRRMGAEGGGYEVEQRRGVGEFASGEVAVAEEASILLVPAHAGPVVEALQREMNVFVGF